MTSLRKYGNPPFKVVVIHGGPGAAGEMAPVARELSQSVGVLEPLQTKDTIDAQVRELRDTVEQRADIPVILIGWSWGAWLGYLLAADAAPLVRKLILVASGPFEEVYAREIMPTRLSRLTDEDTSQLQSLIEALNHPATRNRNILLEQMGKLIDKADSYSPICGMMEPVEVRYDIYQRVWPQAVELRQSGRLLKLGKNIQCPVVAIHGDYDPRPAEGVRGPLLRVIKDFRFILLKNCGHKPWSERESWHEFYTILKRECSTANKDR